jgi:hypothetical protein
MIAFWHAPFERFLHIDADSVCWGNFIDELPWQDFDLIYNEPHEEITQDIQRTQYFNPDRIDPGFAWQGMPFFNSGVFVARKGIFDVEDYLSLLEYQRNDPQSLLCGDQGILNLMTFRKASSGQITTRAWPFQAVVPVIPLNQLENRFSFLNGEPVVRQGDAKLIHWAGPKPKRREPRTFPAPMTYFRREHLRARRGFPAMSSSLALDCETLHTRLTARHGGSYLKAGISKARHILSSTRRRTASPQTD